MSRVMRVGAALLASAAAAALLLTAARTPDQESLQRPRALVSILKAQHNHPNSLLPREDAPSDTLLHSKAFDAAKLDLNSAQASSNAAQNSNNEQSEPSVVRAISDTGQSAGSTAAVGTNTTRPLSSSTVRLAAAAVNGSSSTDKEAKDKVLPGAGAGVVPASRLYPGGHVAPRPSLCPRLGRGLRVLILVTSSPAHTEPRRALRHTWGHAALRNDVALAFVLGVPPPALAAAVAAEGALYGDVIVGNFVDSYFNLTLKTLSMLEWVHTYCPHVLRLLKTDDDMFINVPKLLQFITAHEHENNTIWGKMRWRSSPIRNNKTKYYMPPEQFPGKVYPAFATGPAYLVSGDAVPRLLSAALSLRFMRLEDVFITGLAATAAKVRRVSAPEFVNRPAKPPPCTLRNIIAIHKVGLAQQLDFWKKLLLDTGKC